MDAITFLKEIKSFFTNYFPSFIAVDPNNRTIRYLFYRNFKKFHLSIVVLTPIRIKNGKLEFIPASSKKIAVELRITKTKRTAVYLIGTELYGDWEKILEDKIKVLIELFKEINQCDKCGEYMTPFVNRQKDTGIWFVSIRCRRCGEYRNTTYGIGLKQKLHKYLRHKRT
jgi:hypothetical protein